MTIEEVNELANLLISSERWSEVTSKRQGIKLLKYYIKSDDGFDFHLQLPMDTEFSDYERALEMALKTMMQLEPGLAGMVRFLYDRQCQRGLREITDWR